MAATRQLSTAFASAARTASPTDATVNVPPGAMCALILIDVTAIAATPSVVFNIKGKVPISGTEYTILSSAAVTAVGVSQIEIGPGMDDTANLVESAFLPFELVIDPVHGDADSITYSVQVIWF